jgi:hypothetical protein
MRTIASVRFAEQASALVVVILAYWNILKEAHSVSFENFYLVMFYGNQII